MKEQRRSANHHENLRVFCSGFTQARHRKIKVTLMVLDGTRSRSLRTSQPREHVGGTIQHDQLSDWLLGGCSSSFIISCALHQLLRRPAKMDVGLTPFSNMHERREIVILVYRHRRILCGFCCTPTCAILLCRFPTASSIVSGLNQHCSML